jgi:exopolysaccharide production protein ExoZ
MAMKRFHAPNLDLMRAIAVLAVWVHHVCAYGGLEIPFLQTYGGLVGVQLFFVISGYLISESAQRHSVGDYALHRVLRIFPAYWVAYFAFGLYRGTLSWDHISAEPLAFLLNGLNLQQLHAVALFEFDVIHVSWSLTVEVLWYLVAPIAAIGFLARPLLTFTGLAGVSLGWYFLAVPFAADATVNPSSLMALLYQSGLEGMSPPANAVQRHVLMAAAFPSQLVFFGLGALAHRFRQPLASTPSWAWLLAGLAILGAAPAYAHDLLYGTYLIGVGVALVFAGLLLAPPLRLTPLNYIGQISYSIYLLHFAVLVWAKARFARFGDPLGIGDIYLWATVAMTLLLASVMYHWVEQPGMRLARRLSSGASRPRSPEGQIPPDNPVYGHPRQI